MTLFEKMVEYFKREKIVAFMTAAIICALVGSFAVSHSSSSSTITSDETSGSIYSSQSRLETAEEIKKNAELAIKNLQTDYRFHLIIILFLSLFITGLVLDYRAYQKRSLSPFIVMDNHLLPPIHWGWGDVYKIFALMLFLDLFLSLVISFILSFVIKGDSALNLSLMLSTAFRSVLILVVTYQMLRGPYSQRIKSIGLIGGNVKNQFWTGIHAYAGLIPIYFVAAVVLSLFLKLISYDPPVQTPVQVLYKESSGILILFFSAFMAVVGPIFEEIVFRGFVYPVARKQLGILKGMIVTTTLFAALHANIVAFIPIFILGLALNVLYEKTGSIWPGVVLHGVHNTLMLILTLMVKGLNF